MGQEQIHLQHWGFKVVLQAPWCGQRMWKPIAKVRQWRLWWYSLDNTMGKTKAHQNERLGILVPTDLSPWLPFWLRYCTTINSALGKLQDRLTRQTLCMLEQQCSQPCNVISWIMHPITPGRWQHFNLHKITRFRNHGIWWLAKLYTLKKHKGVFEQSEKEKTAWNRQFWFSEVGSAEISNDISGAVMSVDNKQIKKALQKNVSPSNIATIFLMKMGFFTAIDCLKLETPTFKLSADENCEEGKTGSRGKLDVRNISIFVWHICFKLEKSCCKLKDIINSTLVLNHNNLSNQFMLRLCLTWNIIKLNVDLNIYREKLL